MLVPIVLVASTKHDRLAPRSAILAIYAVICVVFTVLVEIVFDFGFEPLLIHIGGIGGPKENLSVIGRAVATVEGKIGVVLFKYNGPRTSAATAIPATGIYGREGPLLIDIAVA